MSIQISFNHNNQLNPALQQQLATTYNTARANAPKAIYDRKTGIVYVQQSTNKVVNNLYSQIQSTSNPYSSYYNQTFGTNGGYSGCDTSNNTHSKFCGTYNDSSSVGWNRLNQSSNSRYMPVGSTFQNVMQQSQQSSHNALFNMNLVKLAAASGNTALYQTAQQQMLGSVPQFVWN